MARYDAEHKAETRRRIIDTAGERFRRDGIAGSGIATLMSDAGLTNGAFYAHFPSKSDLVANVVSHQLRVHHDALSSLPSGRAALEDLIRDYLSPHHRDHPASVCPTAALVSEIGRGDDAVRESYTRGMQSIIEVIATHLSPRDLSAGRTKALGLFTVLVATLQLASAVSDPELSDEVLAAGIVNALSLLDVAPGPANPYR